MQPVDHIIHAKWIIPCEGKTDFLTDHALIIKDGKILAILPGDEATKQYQAKNTEKYLHHAIIPGLINAHTHIGMNLFRGLADDLALMDWLNHHIWPAERQWVSDELVYDASQLAIAEMIRSGSTCFNDMYFFLQATAKAAETAGVRAHIGITVIDFPTAWAKDPDEYLSKGIEFYQAYQNHPLVTATMAPHAIYTVKENTLTKVKEVAEKYDLKINMHIQETADEVNQSLKETGLRPIKRLHDIDFISPRLIAVHMTQIDEEDMEILQRTKPNIVHCPESNMKLASGICPVTQLKKAGINVALGTDSVASNNDLDMVSEMRSAAFLAKLSTRNPTSLPANDVLCMSTIDGAKALGVDHLTGSLIAGKAADFAVIDLDQIETQPLYHPASQIVYAASRQQVTDVWVNGKQLMKNRKLTTLDEEELLKKAKIWRGKIKQ